MENRNTQNEDMRISKLYTKWNGILCILSMAFCVSMI